MTTTHDDDNLPLLRLKYDDLLIPMGLANRMRDVMRSLRGHRRFSGSDVLALDRVERQLVRASRSRFAFVSADDCALARSLTGIDVRAAANVEVRHPLPTPPAHGKASASCTAEPCAYAWRRKTRSG